METLDRSKDMIKFLWFLAIHPLLSEVVILQNLTERILTLLQYLLAVGNEKQATSIQAVK